MWKKSKLFYRYLISYVLIMMIPMLVLTGFINHSLLRRLRGQYVDDTVQTLNQFMSFTDQNISQLQMLRDHILSRTDLVIVRDLKNITASRTLISELKKYTISNRFIADIVFYLDGDEYVYTSSSSYRFDTFFSDSLYYSDWSAQEFLDIANSAYNQYVRPQETLWINGIPYEIITVMYPMQFRGVKATLLFLVDSSMLKREQLDSGYFIQDDSGTLLFSCGQKELLVELKVNSTQQELSKESVYFEKNRDYLTSSLYSAETGWRYMKITPVREVYGELLRIQNLFYLILLSLLFVGGLLIYWSMTVNYNPLIRLKKFAEDIWKEKEQDEITSIEETLTHLIHENSDLIHENTELRDKTKDAAKAHFLHLLLKGRVLSEENFKQQIKELHMEKLSNPYCFVLVLVLKKNETEEKNKILIDMYELEKEINNQLPGYLREHSENGKYVFLGSLDSEDFLAYRHRVLDLQDELQKKFSVDAALACSMICDSFDKIPQCYLNAALAIDYRFIKGNNCVIDSSQIVLNEEIGAIYPHQLFEKLDYQMKSGDADQIEAVLAEIINYIKNAKLPLYYAKGLCYQMINHISSVVDHVNHEIGTKRSKISYATVLADFDTAEELMEAVRNISLNICSLMRSEKTESESRLLASIKQYITENGMDVNFSVQSMADHFQMSLPAISSFFKSQSGITVIDYVTELRMNQAKELLLQEKHTLNEIVVEVGYLNTSSFIRKFKSIHGLTPGQYVKQYKEKTKI